MALQIWRSVFEEFYEEARNIGPRFFTFQFHPYVSGRAGRARAMRTQIQYMKNAPGVWLPTCSEMAHWCLDNVFAPADASPRVAARG